MANPQLEDGYLRLANELYEAWMRTRVPGEAEQVLKAIIRKTYGFNKKVDRISISQIAAMTRMSNGHVCRAIKILLNMRMVTKKGATAHPTYGIQKNYERWKPIPKKVFRPYKGIPKKGNTKDNTYKDIKRSPAPPDLATPKVRDGTHGDKCDAIILACKSYLDIGCNHAQAGKINKRAESVGQAIIAIRRVKKWLTSKKDFMGAIIRELSESRGSTDKDGKGHPGWPDADWESVKQQDEWFDKDLDKKYGNRVGDVLSQLSSGAKE